jgi:hypothetical protein
MLKQKHKNSKQYSRTDGGNLGKTTFGNFFFLPNGKIYSFLVNKQMSLSYCGMQTCG